MAARGLSRAHGTRRNVGAVNKWHAELLGTPEWAAFLHEKVLPVVTHGVDLGDDLLEIGPGPGAATEWLRHRVKRLVALELEPEAAAALGVRFAGTNVEAVTGDATALPYPDGSFDTVGMFTMLHHVPTRALQDAILAGALRALRRAGPYRLRQSGERPAAPAPRRRYVQPGRPRRLPHPAADNRLRRGHAHGRGPSCCSEGQQAVARVTAQDRDPPSPTRSAPARAVPALWHTRPE